MTRWTIEKLETRRLLAGPEVDLTFGQGGVARAGSFPGEPFVVNELPGGRIVVVGQARANPHIEEFVQDPLVARFNVDGTPDTTFDGDGALILPQDDGF